MTLKAKVASRGKTAAAIHKLRIGDVVDAKKDLVLTVTKGDVAKSKRQQTTSCAVATALCRQIDGVVEARVMKNITLVRGKNGPWRRYKTPKNLYMQLAFFDRYGDFDVGEYVLQHPTGRSTLEYINNKSGGRKKPGGKKDGSQKRRPYHYLSGMRPNGHNVRYEKED